MENKINFRKTYNKPFLKELGDLRSMTLGGSFGNGESGSTTRKTKIGTPQPIGIRRPDGSILYPDGSIFMPDGNIIVPHENSNPP